MPNYTLLDKSDHSAATLDSDDSFSHAKHFNVVTVGFNEIASISGCMPLVVTTDVSTNTRSLATVVGFEEFGNVFCNGDKWMGHAVPLSIQCYPFNYAIEDNGVSMLIDTSSVRFSSAGSNQANRLFASDGEATGLLKRYQSMLADLVTGQQQSASFLSILDSLDLLSPLDVTLHFEDGTTKIISDLLTINESQFASLTAEQVFDLHSQGLLLAINAMMLSLRQYNRLVQLTQGTDNPIKKVGMKLVTSE
ncbi:SapC family protein [Alteromonas sp. A079]|uniref:SapC family protein n=1 Tax=Alteromonas sp. A079 TaxID=3410268 RepID=UPI003B9E44AB